MITKDDVKNLKERLHYYNKFDFYRQKYIVKCEIKMAHAAEQKMNCLSCMTALSVYRRGHAHNMDENTSLPKRRIKSC